jgi:hypothetical protein
MVILLFGSPFKGPAISSGNFFLFFCTWIRIYNPHWFWIPSGV